MYMHDTHIYIYHKRKRDTHIHTHTHTTSLSLPLSLPLSLSHTHHIHHTHTFPCTAAAVDLFFFPCRKAKKALKDPKRDLLRPKPLRSLLCVFPFFKKLKRKPTCLWPFASLADFLHFCSRFVCSHLLLLLLSKMAPLSLSL